MGAGHGCGLVCRKNDGEQRKVCGRWERERRTLRLEKGPLKARRLECAKNSEEWRSEEEESLQAVFSARHCGFSLRPQPLGGRVRRITAS